MLPEQNRQYGKWSHEQLRNAESTACQFLEENASQIADTLRAKTKFLESLIQRVSRKDTDFGERLEYLARIAEIANLIQGDAEGFFELASQPMVAQILRTVPPGKKR